MYVRRPIPVVVCMKPIRIKKNKIEKKFCKEAYSYEISGKSNFKEFPQLLFDIVLFRRQNAVFLFGGIISLFFCFIY